MIRTSDLIDVLAADARPVRRLRSPAVRAALWLALAVLVFGALAAGLGVREDLAQQLQRLSFVVGMAGSLLTVHAIRHTYDPARPFGPWLVAIARRRIADRLRSQGRARLRETVLTPEHESLAAPETMPGEALSEALWVRGAVERLPAGQRKAITLTKLHELSLKQAATISGMSIAALKVATHRALKNLRKTLGQEGGKP